MTPETIHQKLAVLIVETIDRSLTVDKIQWESRLTDDLGSIVTRKSQQDCGRRSPSGGQCPEHTPHANLQGGDCNRSIDMRATAASDGRRCEGGDAS